MLGGGLPKGPRLTDWAQPELTGGQRAYAAKGAWAALALLPKLLEEPELGTPDWLVVAGDGSDDGLC